MLKAGLFCCDEEALLAFPAESDQLLAGHIRAIKQQRIALMCE
jgi:hypothetical protein